MSIDLLKTRISSILGVRDMTLAKSNVKFGFQLLEFYV